jgi:hypothetical protein
MHRRTVVAILTVIALLGGAVSHATHACSLTMHGATPLAASAHAQHHPCAPVSDKRPACCLDAATISGLPADFVRAAEPASSVAGTLIVVAIAGTVATDPCTPALSCAFEHPPSPVSVRSHLFLKTLLI